MKHLTAARAASLLLAAGTFGPAAAAAAEPDVAAIQTAYEAASAIPGARHDKNLEIIKADCSTSKMGGQYLCWLTYTSKSDPAQPLYFDVAAIEADGSGWTLRSGLCRR